MIGYQFIISIHVPTKGTTALRSMRTANLLFQSTYPRRVRHGISACGMTVAKFQSTYPRRVRQQYRNSSATSILFQSTYPRRVRQYFLCFHLLILDFNPRTHEGYDLTPDFSLYLDYPFQSTYPRRVRRRRNISMAATSNFNPRTHEGYDVWNVIMPFQISYFNPRTHEGYDELNSTENHNKAISIHVPTKGTTSKSLMLCGRLDISIHVPTKGTTAILSF